MDPKQGSLDVNTDPGSSPDQGVIADPPTAQPDVNSSPEPSPGEPKAHEDSVPYDRFKEALDKAKVQEEEIAALKAQIPQQQAPPPTQEPAPPQQMSPEDQANWFGIDPNQPQGVQTQPQVDDSIEKRIRDELYENPVKTLAPLIAEIAENVFNGKKLQETQVRRIPDFQQYEAQYYGIPDNMVQQVQQNPETIRFLLAKHQATINAQQGNPNPAQPMALQPGVQPQMQPQQQSQQQSPQNGQPPQNYEELKAQLIEQGRQQAFSQMKTQQGFQAEGGANAVSPTGETFELDEAGKSRMRMLGIPESEWSKVAQRASQG